MALTQKLKRILKEEFPPPDTVTLRDENGIVGVITSERFRDMKTIDRQDLLNAVLASHHLKPEEMRRILILVAVTPEEEMAHTAVD